MYWKVSEIKGITDVDMKEIKSVVVYGNSLIGAIDNAQFFYGFLKWADEIVGNEGEESHVIVAVPIIRKNQKE